MSASGYLKIPRSLRLETDWIDARPKHRDIFNTILMECAHHPYTLHIKGNKVEVLPGQLCMSFREIQKRSGKWISKNDVEGAIKYFSSCQFLRQDIRHGRTIITITHQVLYDCCFSHGQTANQTQVRHKSDTKEEDKEYKQPQQPLTPSQNDEVVDEGSFEERFSFPKEVFEEDSSFPKLESPQQKLFDMCMEFSKKFSVPFPDLELATLIKSKSQTTFVTCFDETANMLQQGTIKTSFMTVLNAKLKKWSH